MKIPESIRIGGVEYEIRREANIRDDGRLCYGKISFEEDTIWLSTSEGMGHQRTCVTLLHEILHGILYQAGTGLDLDEETEEQVVLVLAKGLYQVLEDNGGRLFDMIDPDAELKKELQDKLDRIGGLLDRMQGEAADEEACCDGMAR